MKRMVYYCMLLISAVMVSCDYPYSYYVEEGGQMQDTMPEFDSNYSVQENDEFYEIGHSWKCEGEEYSIALNISEELYNYYRNDREHSAYSYKINGKEGQPNYFGFILSERDRSVMRELSDNLSGRAATEKEKIQMALTFVQYLPYAYDTVSKGVEEYMRYPIETLVDGCGDCEDKSVLLAAILYEMGVDFVLFMPPEHMALGVHCDEVEADRYHYCGDKSYCYMETTSPNWQIGQTPEDYLDLEIEVVPFDASPHLICKGLRLEWQSTTGSNEAMCNLSFTAHNQGPGKVTDLWANVRVVEIEEDSVRRMLTEQRYPLKDLGEGEVRQEEFSLNSEIMDNSVLEVELIGAEASTQVFTLNLNDGSKINLVSQSDSLVQSF